MAESDANDNEDQNQDANEVQAGAVPSLDEVNDMTQAKLDAEESEDEGEDEDNGQGDEDDNDGGGDAGAGEDEDDGGSDDDNQADEDEDNAAGQPEPAAGAKSAAELDTDTTKPGEGKVAIKDFEGKTHYFNNWDEVPDDFEPASYKEIGRFTSEMNQKLAREAQAAEAQQREETARANAEAVAELQGGWDKEIKTLADNKVLPADPKERQTVVDGVYQYMADQLTKGVVIDSWEQAFKAYSFDKAEKDAAARQQSSNKNKQRRGGMVQSGGAPAADRPKVIEGPPPGVGLDAVHEKALSQL